MTNKVTRGGLRTVILVIGNKKMTFFPVHAFGFFNLWLLMVVFALPILFTIIINKRIFHSTSSRFSRSRSKRELKLFIVSKTLMLVYFLYAIVIPLHMNTAFTISGLIVYIIGFAFYSASWITISTSGGEMIFSKGLFRFSRHPVYISSAVLFVGAGLVSNSFFYLGLSILVGISQMSNARAEEKNCLEVFGKEYRQYMAITPRWIGWPARTLAEHEYHP